MSATPLEPTEEELRFRFGQNWQKFRLLLDETRIQNAVKSLDVCWPDQAAENPEQPLRFLDAGSGSGLFSLAARRKGAEVFSFDYDADSVACTQRLKETFYSDDSAWRVEQGSLLDADYLDQLGLFDIVYSWGVIHHTGQMWRGLELIQRPVKPGGRLMIAIYNDQGWKSRFWKIVKQFYCSGLIGRWLMTALFVPGFLLAFLLADLLRRRTPWRRYRPHHDPRGMSVVTDIIDWIGGYPFEVATADELRNCFLGQSWRVVWEKTTSGLGCHEFVFQRTNT